HIAVVGALGETRLDLDGLLDGFGRKQLLEGGGAILEGLFGVIAHLGGDALPALAPLAKHLDDGVDIALPELLVVLEGLDHGGGSRRHGRWGGFYLCVATEIYATHNALSSFMLRRGKMPSPANIPRPLTPRSRRPPRLKRRRVRAGTPQ